MSTPLATVGSIKVKLGLLVAASVLVAMVVSVVGYDAGVPLLLAFPVTVALALGVTQLLAVGMTSPSWCRPAGPSASPSTSPTG